MNQPVSIGDDGRGPGAPDDGPLLAALKGWFAEQATAYRTALEDHRLAVRQALYTATPNAVPLQAGGTVPAGGTLVLDLGAPQIGRRWIVRKLAVSNGVSVASTLTGRADWYVGQPPGVGQVPNPASWQWAMAALPAVQPFSSESIPVLPSDHLYAVITTGTSGQIAVASATILDYSADSAAGPAVQVI